MRVGFWRIKRMLDDLGIRPTVTLNARTCLEYPRVAEACLEAGWEFNAHSYEQIPMHKLEDERAVIDKTLDVLGDFCGKCPRGWFGPGQVGRAASRVRVGQYGQISVDAV